MCPCSSNQWPSCEAGETTRRFLSLREMSVSGNRKCRIMVAGWACITRVIWLEKITDVLLAELYSAALMTIVPSFEEGFGLPVIESMACGTPVICSQAASLPEVAGDAALYFSPHSCEQLTENIEHLMDSTATRERLVAAGLARSSLFSQQRFGERQAAAIHGLLSN